MKKSLKTTVILLVIGAAYFAAIELAGALFRNPGRTFLVENMNGEESMNIVGPTS
jgi:hypothetical protein